MHPQTTRTTQPTSFAIPHQRPSLDITTSRVDDISDLETMFPQATRFGLTYPFDRVIHNDVLADILRHHDRYANLDVIRGV